MSDGSSLCHDVTVDIGIEFIVFIRRHVEYFVVLILTRKSSESIVVGDQIRVVVVEVKGRQVRLGIEAPGDTKIFRGEIFDRIQAENSRASQVEAAALSGALDLWSQFRSEDKTNAD